MNFDQSTYIVDEDNGPVQPILVLSNPSTVLIIVQVNSTDGSALGKSNHDTNIICNINIGTLQLLSRVNYLLLLLILYISVCHYCMCKK